MPKTKKKSSSKPGFGSKSAFVRSLDPKTPAAEVVKLAKEKGMTLTLGLVYNIRSAAKSGATGSPKAKRGGGAGLSMTGAEARLRDAIADLGLVKASAILEGVRAAIRRQ